MVCGDAKNRINKNEKGLIESKRAEFYLNCSKKKTANYITLKKINILRHGRRIVLVLNECYQADSNN